MNIEQSKWIRISGCVQYFVINFFPFVMQTATRFIAVYPNSFWIKVIKLYFDLDQVKSSEGEKKCKWTYVQNQTVIINVQSTTTQTHLHRHTSREVEQQQYNGQK